MRAVSLNLVLALLLLIPCRGLAAGFLVFEAGAKALGMAGAMTAQADDPSAIFFNPAGIATLDGTQVYGGFSVIFTGTEFAGVDPNPGFGVTEKTGTLTFFPINAYVTHTINPKWAVGLGLFTPFGLGQKWESAETFTGRYISYDVDLKAIYVNPTLAWRPIEKLSFGLGLQLVYTKVDLNQYLQQWDPNGTGFLNVGTLSMKGDNGLDAGLNVGGRYQLNNNFIFGVSYRSKVTAEFKGDANFTQIPSGNTALDTVVATQFPQDQGGSTKITFPWMLSLAAAYDGLDRWVFEIDFNIVGWSNFDELAFQFENDPSLNTTRVQDYENTLSIRAGAGYELTDALALRAGYYYDPTPQPTKAMSPLLADIDRHGITAGLGYGWGEWTFDGFLLFLLAGDRETDGQSLDDYNGTYASFGNIFGVNLGYKF